MKSCEISFIIPVYNAEKYIEKCVNSILEQTMDSFEIILINDGSSDASSEICQRIQRKYQNIILIEQENRGQGAARNVGIDVSNGEWLCFIDNDDWLEPTFYSECSKYLHEDIDLIFFAKRDIWNRSKTEYLLNISSSEYIIDSPMEREVLQKFVLNFYYSYPINLGRLPVGTPWGKLIKAKLFKENDCYFVEGYGEDRPCMIKIYSYANKIFVINKVLYNYYVHESAMRKYLPNAIEKYQDSLQQMNQYVNEKFEKKPDFKNQLYHFNIAWFSYCVLQDFVHKNNPQSYRIRKKAFLSALENKYYRVAFEKADIGILPVRRRVLAFLIKKRWFGVIVVMNIFNDTYLFVKKGLRK